MSFNLGGNDIHPADNDLYIATAHLLLITI